jgi:hypothetical protein
MKRLKLFAAGADLLENSMSPPVKEYPDTHGVGLRFAGETRSGQRFYAQILVKKGGGKYLMSTFPSN